MTGRRRCGTAGAAALLLLGGETICHPARAQLTFPGASPISAGNVVLMENPTLSTAGGGYQNLATQGVLVYGITSQLALITQTYQPVWTATDATAGGKTVRLTAVGAGDTIQEARYTVYQLDGIGSTLRVAPLIGLAIPTGMDDSNPAIRRSEQPGTGNWGGRAALTSSWQTLYWNAEAEIEYRDYIPGAGYQFGNTFLANAAFHYVLWPTRITPNIPGELFASFETNFSSARPNRAAGASAPGTGGQLWLVDPGLDWSTSGYGVAFTALLPVLQQVYGQGRRYDWGFLFHIRISLYTPHHW